MSSLILPKGPWKRALEWDLHAKYYGDTYIPFARHVRSEPRAYLSPSFTLFPSLPLELKLRILSFCTAATLFQLMQVSSMMREEAAKLFWSNPSVWYTVDAS
jgi:hypothetical protein